MTQTAFHVSLKETTDTKSLATDESRTLGDFTGSVGIKCEIIHRGVK